MRLIEEIEALRITFNPVTVNTFSQIGRVANNQAIDDVLKKLNPYFEEKDKPDALGFWLIKHPLFEHGHTYAEVFIPDGIEKAGLGVTILAIHGGWWTLDSFRAEYKDAKWIKAIVPEVAQPVS